LAFLLDGEHGLLAALERRLDEKHHAVIVVAEGAGQHLMADAGKLGKDASGNLKLGDIGGFLSERIHGYFADKGESCAMKFIDPSYMIRSQAANSIDSEFCLMLGQHAVHAGMSGRTAMFVGFWNQTFTCVPLQAAVGSRRHIDPKGNLWRRVLEATGQGDLGAADA
jgi:6-phosphofructokinase 1